SCAPSSTLFPTRRSSDLIDHEFRQCAAETGVNLLGQVDTMRGAEQVKISGVAPLLHNREPVEQRNVVLLRHHLDIVEIWRRRDRSEEHTSELQSRENLVC